MLAETALTKTNDRRAISKMLMQLFAHWELTTKEMLEALGFSPKSRSRLTRFRKGSSISSNRDTMERASRLLGIHKSLRLLLSDNRDLAYAWVKTRNRAFENRAPIKVIGNVGVAWLIMVGAYLDRARGH